MTYKDAAYYGSYATIDSSILNGHHGYRIQWAVILYLKKNNIKRYETGVNYYKDTIWNYNSKNDEISKYQRGYRSLELPKISYKLTFEEME